MTAAPTILAIDQGTTNSKALLVDASGTIVARASRPMRLDYPRSGWAEQSAEAIWDSVVAVIAELVAAAPDHAVAAVAISNQRETVVLWDRATGRPLGPAVGWQCRRSAERCAALRAAGHADAIAARSGLCLDPLFSAGKLAWLIDAAEDGRARAAAGAVCGGTIDSWLLWKLTGGTVHATDHGNASRTQLYDIHAHGWDAELARLFDVPLAILPAIHASDSRFGTTAEGATALPAGVPIHAMMGDSHAALFGHGVRTPGPIKVTIGTGSSIMTLTDGPLASAHGLSSTIAWAQGPRVGHALEGNITVSGEAVAFAARLLGLADEAAVAALAATVPDSGGVVFVPALAGLGAPYWRDQARGVLSGLSLGTTPAHIARAAVDAVAQQIADVVAAMRTDLGTPVTEVLVDGGATRNAALLQLLADLLDAPVLRSPQPEASALGAAAMAADALGWPQPATAEPDPANRFTPRIDAAARDALRTAWRRAVAAT